jgi:hypothetical protein
VSYRALRFWHGFLALSAASVVASLTIANTFAAGVDPNERLAPEIAEGLVLRESWYITAPKCTQAVYVHSVSVHHTKVEQSTIACSDDQHHWKLTQITQEGSGGLLAGIEKKLVAQKEREMTPDEGQRLDKLLSQLTLYQEQVRGTGEVGVGAPSHVMQIVATEGNTVARWNGRLLGDLGQVADTVLGRD